MAEALRMGALRSRALVAAICVALPAACAPAVPPAVAPSPGDSVARVPPPPELLAAHAELIRLEDRRELDLPLVRALASDPSSAIRARTAITLGRLRRAEGAPILQELLADADSAVAASAAFALGQLGDSAYATALSARLASTDTTTPTVGVEVAQALGKVGGAAARATLLALLDTLPVQGSRARLAGEALLAVWKTAPLPRLEPLQRWLTSADGELRWKAAYALARGGGARAAPGLLQVLADPDPRVRAEALRALTVERIDSAGVPRPEAAERILPLVRDSAYPVAINALRVLGGYGAPPTIEALRQALRSGDRHLALAAAEALGRAGTAARAAASDLAAVASPDSLPAALRAAAVESLARIDPSSGEAAAAGLAASPDWRLRAAAARAVAIVHGGNVEALRPALADPDPRVAAAALNAVIEAADSALTPIRNLLVEQLGARDVMVRTAALSALARAPDPSLLPLLLDAYDRAQADSLPDAALAALDGIGALSERGPQATRAFLARFDRPDDPLLRLRAVQRLDSAAVVARWGDPLPIDTGRDPEWYRSLVERLVAPALASGQGVEAVLVTRGDTLRLRLFAARAPLTVENFLTLADAGYYDGQEWPRVVPNFVVQGGDPRGDTSGGPGYSIRDEINRIRYGAGTVGMALAGPDTGGSQFFITHSPQPHLDATYTVFGEVVAGQETTRSILPGDLIDSIRSVR